MNLSTEIKTYFTTFAAKFRKVSTTIGAATEP